MQLGTLNPKPSTLGSRLTRLRCLSAEEEGGEEACRDGRLSDAESDEDSASLLEVYQSGAAEISSSDRVAAGQYHDRHASGAPAPLLPQMVTLSLLPRTQWQNLAHLDAIKVGKTSCRISAIIAASSW